jgi:hypothetical protein
LFFGGLQVFYQVTFGSASSGVNAYKIKGSSVEKHQIYFEGKVESMPNWPLLKSIPCNCTDPDPHTVNTESIFLMCSGNDKKCAGNQGNVN